MLNKLGRNTDTVYMMKHWKAFGILGIIAAFLVWGAISYFSKPAAAPQLIPSHAEKEKEMEFQNRRLEREHHFPPPTGKSKK